MTIGAWKYQRYEFLGNGNTKGMNGVDDLVETIKTNPCGCNYQTILIQIKMRLVAVVDDNHWWRSRSMEMNQDYGQARVSGCKYLLN
jgi:hypothetical protein